MFDRLLVVEFATVLAGPSVGQFLAELGARVVKIEPPSGDVTRSWHRADEDPNRTASYFAAANFGKESVALDLRSPQGLRAARALAAKADIVLTSFRPGHAESLGLDFASLAAERPELILGSISGYGPDQSRPGYDAVIQAESGFMAMNGHPDGEPAKLPVALMDVLAAHHLKQQLLVALMERQSTGRGRHVTVSLMDAAVSSLANQASGTLRTARDPGRMGSAHPNIAPYGTVLTTRDGTQVLLAVGSDRQFRALCGVLSLPDLPRFASNAERVRHRNELEALIRQAAADRDSEPLLAEFERLGVPAGRLRPVSEALADAPHLVLGGAGLRQWLGSPQPVARPPALGQHTRTVLSELTDLEPGLIDRICDA